MSDVFDPKRIVRPSRCIGQARESDAIRYNEPFLLRDHPSKKMRLKQSYAHRKPPLLVCNRCDGESFQVANEEHLTVIRCVKCLWEAVIHDG